jgi:hypothetical protein
MVVAFQTLLLGLAFGTQPVTVMVTPEVRRVEFVLDGESLGAIVGPPWTMMVDFGAEPHPHELVAVARDAAHKKLGLAHEWVNLPGPQSEVGILLEHVPDGHQVIGARLTWEDVKLLSPRRVRATLDGKRLRVADKASFPLPPCDPGEPHVLSVTVEFPGGRRARADVAFGGHLAAGTEAELTAISVEVDAGHELPPVSALQDWFVDGDRPVRVAAVEKGAADVALVLDRGSSRFLDKVEHAHQIALGTFGAARTYYATGSFRRAREGENRLCLLSGVPQTYAGSSGNTRDLFDASIPLAFEAAHFAAKLAGSAWQTISREQRIADAVAVAGLNAADRGHRRGVVLLLGEDSPDDSRIEPSAARRYLAELRVPLVVWATAPGNQSAAAWEPVDDTSTEHQLDAAAARLAERLARQRIVWLEGLHLPQNIVLTEKARDTHLAR